MFYSIINIDLLILGLLLLLVIDKHIWAYWSGIIKATYITNNVLFMNLFAIIVTYWTTITSIIATVIIIAFFMKCIWSFLFFVLYFIREMCWFPLSLLKYWVRLLYLAAEHGRFNCTMLPCMFHIMILINIIVLFILLKSCGIIIKFTAQINRLKIHLLFLWFIK